MNLVVMLTHHDKTVKDALEIFESCKELPVQHWGFKNVGLPVPEMKGLVAAMKAAGKTTHMEVVTYTEEECLEAAKLAVECEFDYLLGTVYYPSVQKILEGHPIKYFPFCGKVWGSPSVLGETIEEIVEDAKRFEELGIDGTDLLAYRFTGDAEALIREFAKTIQFPVLIAGSVSTFKRIDFLKEINPWGFTVGSAFFESSYVPEGGFYDNLKAVAEYLEK
ncbi:MAG: hypothetical protein HFI63_00875 [Lachnospiraceae bacterium]|nr:hypothetical protein [Lachnospiraceae bacterium]